MVNKTPSMAERGDVFWADLGPVTSSAPAKRRPVVVVQAGSFNRSRLATVIVAAISSNTALAGFPGNVFLPAALSGLPRDSVVDITALATVDKAVLTDHVGTLPRHLVTDIADGLELVFEL